MAYVAYTVVLALLGAAGVAFWAGQGSRSSILPPGDRPSPPAAAVAAPVATPPPAQGLKLPPRAATPAAAAAPGASVAQKPPAAPSPAPVPLPSVSPAAATAPATPPAPAPASPAVEANPADPTPVAAPMEKPAPVKSKCTADAAPWPAERTEQGKAIQGMLRDLGLYEGTVYGTVGPTTRAAIRKFQVSAGQPETGEPDEALFESLRKKCVAP
jgi:hypothetical protein